MNLTTQPLPSMTADTRVATVPDVTAAAAVFSMVSDESMSHGAYSRQPYVTRGAGCKASSRGGLRGGRTSPVRGVRSGSRSDSTINPGRLAYGMHRLPTRRSGSRHEGCGKFGASSTRGGTQRAFGGRPPLARTAGCSPYIFHPIVQLLRERGDFSESVASQIDQYFGQDSVRNVIGSFASMPIKSSLGGNSIGVLNLHSNGLEMLTSAGAPSQFFPLAEPFTSLLADALQKLLKFDEKD